MDVDWRNNVSFATSSTDNMIYVCKVGDSSPVKTFAGHQVYFLVVNCIQLSWPICCHITCLIKDYSVSCLVLAWSCDNILFVSFPVFVHVLGLGFSSVRVNCLVCLRSGCKKWKLLLAFFRFQLIDSDC